MSPRLTLSQRFFCESETLSPVLDALILVYAIPAFHLLAHKWACQVSLNANRQFGAGKWDLEHCERVRAVCFLAQADPQASSGPRIMCARTAAITLTLVIRPCLPLSRR